MFISQSNNVDDNVDADDNVDVDADDNDNVDKIKGDGAFASSPFYLLKSVNF